VNAPSDHGDVTLALDEKLRPPMANGEVVFEAPWQGRVFGMAVALRDANVFVWPEFQQSLIEVIAEHDALPSAAPYAYFDHFANALQRLLAAKGLVQEQDLTARTDAYLARPHGHDHHHGHDHAH